MKKVLIVTYYWPPSGDPGVQRIIKFVKYLPELGWMPIILTVAQGDYSAIDENLVREIPAGVKVYKTASLEPSGLYRKFVGMQPGEKIPVANVSEKNLGWKKRLSNWVRLNLFIPDAKLGWVPYAVRQGKQIIKEEQPDLIFSTSPPPTVHLIARRLAKWSQLKWVADFRDPWTDIYHYDDVKRLRISLKRDVKLEQQVIENADKIVTVSQGFADLLLKNGNCRPKLSIIPNGFDSEDFTEGRPMNKNKFVLSYAGKITSSQNPKNLWQVLSRLVQKNSDFAKHFQLSLMGNISSEIKDELSLHQLLGVTDFCGFLSYPEMLSRLQESSMLLLLIPNTLKNKGIMTGKIYSYLALQHYVLGIGPVEGDASYLLRTTGAGQMFAFEEKEELEHAIMQQFWAWKEGHEFCANTHEIIKYTRENLTEQLVEAFEKE